MQTRVDRTVFERMDFGSFGWLKEGPLTPFWEIAFFGGVDSQTRSFRKEEEVRLSLQLPTQPVFCNWFQGSPPVPAVGGNLYYYVDLMGGN